MSNLNEMTEMVYEHNGQSDLQTAFAVSRMRTTIVDQTVQIKEATREGFFVVVTRDEVTCPSTDALLGISIQIESVHAERADAEAICPEPDEYRFICGPTPSVAGAEVTMKSVVLDSKDIAF